MRGSARSKKSTPMPAKMAFAGENTWGTELRTVPEKETVVFTRPTPSPRAAENE
jgi:hypothetical protein